MSDGVRLLRRLILEAPEHEPDGFGGFVVTWRTLGTLWADVRTRGGREDFTGARPRPRIKYRILVRTAPVGAPSRPVPQQRLRDGARVFQILTVTESDATGKHLEIVAEEGLLP